MRYSIIISDVLQFACFPILHFAVHDNVPPLTASHPEKRKHALDHETFLLPRSDTISSVPMLHLTSCLFGLIFVCITPAAAFSISGNRAADPAILELSRRDVLSISFAATASPLISLPQKATSIESTTFVTGTATLQTGVSNDNIESGAALYVTCRPNRPDNVPRAILDGSRGKPPPVLAARFENPQFPFEFSLTTDNLTPEGASVVEGSNNVWWSGEDLVVSARLDSDGVAATRDPNDLVGRGFYSSKAQDAVIIELQGRGVFGKAVTSKK